MDYLKDFNMNDEQIKDVEQAIKTFNINEDLFIFDSDKIIEILNLFKSYGINNLYEILITNPTLFCDPISSIRLRVENYGNVEELAKLINEDVNNLSLVDLL